MCWNSPEPIAKKDQWNGVGKRHSHYHLSAEALREPKEGSLQWFCPRPACLLLYEFLWGTFLSGVQADLGLFPSMNPKATCRVSLLGCRNPLQNDRESINSNGSSELWEWKRIALQKYFFAFVHFNTLKDNASSRYIENHKQSKKVQDSCFALGRFFHNCLSYFGLGLEVIWISKVILFWVHDHLLGILFSINPIKMTKFFPSQMLLKVPRKVLQQTLQNQM